MSQEHLLEDKWPDLVRDKTLLEHLGFFARVSMHGMSQMFWIHGPEPFLWTILFRVTVQKFTIIGYELFIIQGRFWEHQFWTLGITSDLLVVK